MALSDGESASGGDVWLRIATHKDYIKNGRVQHGAFGGNAIAAPSAQNQRAWNRELSGRLRSVAGSVSDIVSHAERFCADQTRRGGGTKVFHGVMYSRVGNIKRIYKDTIASNVHFTPNPPSDPAQSDLTFTGWNINTRPELEEFTIWLSDYLHALYPAQLEEHLPDAQPETPFARILTAILKGVHRLAQTGSVLTSKFTAKR
jgi:hypothetical protein